MTAISSLPIGSRIFDIPENKSEPLDRKIHHFALLVFGKYDMMQTKGSEKQQRLLYTSARILAKVYAYLKTCRQIPFKEIKTLYKKAQTDPFQIHSDHMPWEGNVYSKIRPLGKPSVALIKHQINIWQRSVKASDIIWIFLVGHGDEIGFGLDNHTVLHPNALQEILETKPNIKYNIIVDCCYSGSFLALSSSSTTVLTSAYFNEESRTDTSYAVRYSTIFTAQLRSAQDTLLGCHLRALSPLSSNYDSLSYTLDNFLYEHAQDFHPDHPPLKANNTNLLQFLPSPIPEIEEIVWLCNTASQTTTGALRYFYLKDKLVSYLENADSTDLKKLAQVTAPLITKFSKLL